MERIRIICTVITLLLVSNLSLAGQMLVLPATIETEVSLSTPPCHQIDQSAEAQGELPCCIDDCSNCLMSSLVSSEQVWLVKFNPEANSKLYNRYFSDRNIGALYRPPIFA